MAERTLIIIKPDAVQRRLMGEIISRFERKGLKIVAVKFLQLSRKQAAQLYTAHVEKAFFNPLVKYMCSSPILVMILEADKVIEISRKMLGATLGYDAEMGTIRGTSAFPKDIILFTARTATNRLSRKSRCFSLRMK